MKYSYILLRYIHDVVREEVLNLGVLLYSPDDKFIGFQARDNLEDIKKVFPDFEPMKLRVYLSKLENIFAKRHEELSKQLQLKKPTDVAALAHEIVQPDNSSVQWGRMGSGITKDLSKTLSDLNLRYVQQSQLSTHKAKRTDDQVWSEFKRELKKRNILTHFKPKTIKVKGVSQTYEHTFQNSKLHCLQPLSLDLAKDENILKKVYEETGRHYVMQKDDKAPEVKLYYLVGAPKHPKLHKDFKHAVEILSLGGNAEVFMEDQAAQLSERLNKIINKHYTSKAQN